MDIDINLAEKSSKYYLTEVDKVSTSIYCYHDLMGEHFDANCSAENHYEDLKPWLLPGFSPGSPPDFGPFEDNS